MSTAEDLAEEYERGEHDVKVSNAGAKRSKAEQAEHKHPHPEGDTRKIVANAVMGEDKRKEQNQQKERAKEHKETSGSK